MDPAVDQAPAARRLGIEAPARTLTEASGGEEEVPEVAEAASRDERPHAPERRHVVKVLGDH